MRNPKSVLAIAVLLISGLSIFAEAQQPQPLRKAVKSLGKCLTCLLPQTQQAVQVQAVPVVQAVQTVQYSSAQVAPFTVGAPDHDGLIISSIGSPVAVVSESRAPTLLASHESSLRSDFHKMIYEKRQAGEISLFEYALLYDASFSKSFMDRVENLAHSVAKVESTTGALDASKVDWVALLKVLLPIILDFFSKK